MKKLLCLFFFLFYSFNVYGYTITYSDNEILWPGQSLALFPFTDYWGPPNITGGQLEINNNSLQSLTVNFEHWDNNGVYSYLNTGDLFIDINNNSQWDYVVSFWNYDTRTSHNGDYTSGLQGYVYQLNEPLYVHSSFFDTNAYYISNQTHLGGSIPRLYHPIALNLNHIDYTLLPINPVLYGWDTPSIIMTNLNIPLNGNFTFGYTISCANDVLYENISMNPVPEPSTILLFLLGFSLLIFKYKS